MILKNYKTSMNHKDILNPENMMISKVQLRNYNYDLDKTDYEPSHPYTISKRSGSVSRDKENNGDLTNVGTRSNASTEKRSKSRSRKTVAFKKGTKHKDGIRYGKGGNSSKNSKSRSRSKSGNL